MSPEELTTLTSSTTRRTIVKTGAKIAYSTPLVAAAFKLSAANALGQRISGECTTGENCETGVIANCGPEGVCACVLDVDGRFACVARACSEIPCTTGSECDSGMCITAPGCCLQIGGFCGTKCEPIQDGIQRTSGWSR